MFTIIANDMVHQGLPQTVSTVTPLPSQILLWNDTTLYLSYSVFSLRIQISNQPKVLFLDFLPRFEVMR